jgi:hypothetical protein
MDAFVVAYYRAGAGAYRAVIPAFPTEDARGATLADLVDDARHAIAQRLGVDAAAVRVAPVRLAAYAAAAPCRGAWPAGRRIVPAIVIGDRPRAPGRADTEPGVASDPQVHAEGAPHG